MHSKALENPKCLNGIWAMLEFASFAKIAIMFSLFNANVSRIGIHGLFTDKSRKIHGNFFSSILWRIKAVADHTVKIILDSALELTNWIPALLSPSFLSLTTPIFSFEIVSEQLPIKGFTNSQINETIKILFSNPFPNKLKICFDSCCDLIKIEKFRLFCEKHLWEHLDSDEDGVITIGDLYEFIANFNIWKLLYKVFKATDPYICVVFSRSKRTFKISKIEYVN